MGETPDAVNTFWEAYGDSSLLVEVTCNAPNNGESIAEHVLDTFGIPRTTNVVGGNLKDLDIKHMDAMAALNLSLLETIAEEGDINGIIYEPTVDEDGKVIFIKIGEDTASLSDIYYQVQTSSYVETCKGVLIRGGKRMPSWKELDWKPIWANSDYKLVMDTSRMVSNCMSENYSTHAIILFNDPHLDSHFDDGIDNLYDITEPYNTIVGYTYLIDAPGSTDKTKITHNRSTVVPVQVGGTNPSMGKLQSRPTYDPELQEDDNPDCWLGGGERIGKIEDAVKIILPPELRYEDIRGTTVDKFVKVEEVSILGKELFLLHAGAIDDNKAANQDPDDSNTIVLIAESSSIKRMHKLDEGKHYAIIYDEEEINGTKFKVPYIIFAKDARVNEPRSYGQNTKYKISQFGDSGRFNAGKEGVGTIFPVADNKGYLVEEIWVQVSVDSPSIAVYDPEFNDETLVSKAINIAHALTYYISPIIVYEPTETMAFNGNIIDQTPTVKDNNPRTVQDFTTTGLEAVMDELDGGGGTEFTLPFFNEPEDDVKLEALSENLFNYMNSGNGTETTYVCGPNTEVHLGESGPAGGVVNNITYSYTDSGSYTISVNEGPRLVKPFSGGGPSGPTFKASESYSARGTIIDSIGNGMFFKVRIDGYGERTAINMQDQFLKVGDIVSCSIHNNPVES